jgi:hypothetical protein
MDQIIEAYLNFPKEIRHRKLYELFEKKIEDFDLQNQNILQKHHNLTKESWHELIFYYMWLLLIQSVPNNFKFLEIGVYKGRVLSLIELLNKHLNKNGIIKGISPLSTTGDKYAAYENLNYYKCIENNYKKLGLDIKNINIIQGYSQDPNIVKKASDQYDIIFIDGCHDYEIVCKDIENYGSMIKKNGLLVIDDCACHIDFPYSKHTERGVPYYGYTDVSNAVKDKIDTTKFKFLFAISHNIVWQKIL